MNMQEIERALRELRLSGIAATLSTRVMQAQSTQEPFLDTFAAILLQGGPAWLVGDHVKARRHFRAAAQRGHPLGQYNLAMMLLNREGGPCDVAHAVSLLRKSADAGISLARDALEQIQNRGTARNRPTRPLSCSLPRQARSTPAVEPIQPTVAL
jgi:hypothetical protein